jgi:hypothetical protein
MSWLFGTGHFRLDFRESDAEQILLPSLGWMISGRIGWALRGGSPTLSENGVSKERRRHRQNPGWVGPDMLRQIC